MSSESGARAGKPEGNEARAFEAEFLRFWGPMPPFTICPIGWQPSALAPVFYGYRDYSSQPVDELAREVAIPGGGPGAGVVRLPPATLRVFYPSLDGSPQDAEILGRCGNYPLILFVHGDCEGGNEGLYRQWIDLPAQLARAGYVVAVPELLGIGAYPPDNEPVQATLLAVLAWMRENWEFAGTLMPAPATGLAGHSYGGLHAGILATKVQVACVAYLSAGWTEWSSGPMPITQLQVPQMFTWGTGSSDNFAVLEAPIWDQIATPKHLAEFSKGEHWDYLNQVPLPCREIAGPCPYLGPAAFDMATMFFGRYLPPEYWPNLPDEIPVSLVPPPPLTLTPAQLVYAGGYLQGWPAFQGDPGACSAIVAENLPVNETVPYVLFTPANLAVHVIEARGLVPVLSGASGTGAWVHSQSPMAGTPVNPGTQVDLVLENGPIP
jgi:hypothetical protein